MRKDARGDSTCKHECNHLLVMILWRQHCLLQCNVTTSFSVVTDWWVLIRTKPVSVYRSLWSDDRTVWSTFVIYLIEQQGIVKIIAYLLIKVLVRKILKFLKYIDFTNNLFLTSTKIVKFMLISNFNKVKTFYMDKI